MIKHQKSNRNKEKTMKDTIKYAKNKGYCYDNRHLFSELRKILLKEEKPVISREMTTIKLHKLVEDINKAMAEEFIEKQELEIPYIGTLVAFERERYYNPKTKRTNLPIFWGKTRQMKRDNELGKGKHIFNINVPKLVRIRFTHKRKPHSAIFQFRTCQDVATRLIHYVTDNSVKLFKESYGKRN